MLVGALIGNALWFRARLPHAGAAFAIACPAHDLPERHQSLQDVRLLLRLLICYKPTALSQSKSSRLR